MKHFFNFSSPYTKLNTYNLHFKEWKKKTLILLSILTAGLWLFNKTVTLESDIHHIYFYLSTAHKSQHMFCLRIFLFFNLKF